MAALFEERYPNIAAWVQDGWIEISHDSNRDKALAGAEQAIAEWLDSH